MYPPIYTRIHIRIYAWQVELLESLGWTYTELGYAQRAIECMVLLCQASAGLS